MLNIVIAPNNVLSEQAKEISKIDKSILDLIEEMKIALNNAKDPEGVGLAAPQVGKSLQLFIIKPNPKANFQIFINPKIIEMADEKIGEKRKTKNKKLEGCLSLPSIWGEVTREPSVKLSYLDEKGKPHTRKFTGFVATIIQHETDHLKGILFPKRILEQNGILYKSRKNKTGEDIFEEIDL